MIALDRSGARANAELLRRVLHAGEEGIEPATLAGLDAEKWNALAALAEAHRVGPLVQQRLERDDVRAVVPEPVRAQLRQSYDTCCSRNAVLFERLAEVLLALAAERIHPIVLKGPHLAQLVYGDLGLRWIGDIDLLVARDDVDAAARVLLGLGFRSAPGRAVEMDYDEHFHLRPFIRGDGFPVEVHRAIDYPAGGGQSFHADALRERARRVTLGRVEAWVLSPEDLLLHLALHISFQHRFCVTLQHVADIPAAVGYAAEMQWDRFVERNERAGTSRHVYFALAVAQRLFGFVLPDDMMRALRPRDADERLLGRIAEFVLLRLSHRAPDTVRLMQHRRGVVARAQEMFGSVFPTPRHMREIYQLPAGSPAVLAYYLVRPFDLLRRGASFLLRLASRDEGALLAREMSTSEALIDHLLDAPRARWDDARTVGADTVTKTRPAVGRR